MFCQIKYFPGGSISESSAIPPLRGGGNIRVHVIKVKGEVHASIAHILHRFVASLMKVTTSHKEQILPIIAFLGRRRCKN